MSYSKKTHNGRLAIFIPVSTLAQGADTDPYFEKGVRSRSEHPDSIIPLKSNISSNIEGPKLRYSNIIIFPDNKMCYQIYNHIEELLLTL